MAETKTKRPARKKTPAGHSPVPHSQGSLCGHSGCGPSCNVRYSGPTSHPRDHLIHQAAHGARHVWMASVVAGLAVVLTGAMAYTAVQAETAPRVKNLNEAVSAMWKKLDSIEKTVKQIDARLGKTGGAATSTAGGQGQGGQNGQGGQQKPQLTTEQITCLTTCQTAWKSCQESAGTESSAKEACTTTAKSCLTACVPSGTPVPPVGGQQGGGQGNKPSGEQGSSPQGQGGEAPSIGSEPNPSTIQ